MGVFACGMLAALWIEHRAASRRPILLGAGDDARWRSRARRSSSATRRGWRRPLSLGGWRPALRDLPAAAGFALVIAAVAAGRGPVLRGLAWRPLAGAGIVSYGLYLWHLPVLLAVREAGLLPEPFVAAAGRRARAVVPRGVAQLAARRAPGDRVVAPARAAPRAAGRRRARRRERQA